MSSNPFRNVLLRYQKGFKAMAKKKTVLSLAKELEAEKERQAENRRKLLAALDPKAREYAREAFAQLGLTQ